MTLQVTSRTNRPGHRAAYVGTWVTEDEKRRLLAMCVLRGRSQSDTLRDLIVGTPLEGAKTESGAHEGARV